MTKMQTAINALNELSAEELSLLIPTFNQILKTKRAQVATMTVAKNDFRVGDILSYVSSRGRTKGERFYFKFNHMNRRGDCAQGKICKADGSPEPLWGTATVPPAMIDMVNGKKIAR